MAFMAIDMGSASTIIAVRGRGVVVDEPSLIAVDTASGDVIDIGREARQKYGREARGVAVIAPMLNGVVADFERTQEMLAHFVRKARGGLTSFGRRALMSVFSDVTPVERRALLSAAQHARVGRVGLIEEGLAAPLLRAARLSARALTASEVQISTLQLLITCDGIVVCLSAPGRPNVSSWKLLRRRFLLIWPRRFRSAGVTC
jgi:rod shape-determining protein MreB